ncbi:hypothetical protein JRO89_XS08G0111900 [Xanthoceras sorbifolium]|uniref:Poly(A) polymerase n=1 Tax=Xanthoceras sorbifolium TaxID=99658 RepID=A0ABQ8HPH7_9ROSI|nr:hypothetical protein JRO89_XS08G0111900 [Xanthoceras sorbifolium]
MSTFVKAKDYFFSRLKSLTRIQRFNHTMHPQIRPETEMGSDNFTQQVNASKWKKVDGSTLGIHRSLIPEYSWKVLNILRYRGYQVYLVGGCVRDLILKKVPKDFDVITTANLNEVQKQFRRCQIIGKRFPICQVHIKGSIIEVSSFETVAKQAEGTEKVLSSRMPSGCDEEDFIRWRDSMHRDFTINSLFLDPFSNKIYDYANGIADLRSLKLQTLIPAHLSFKEDCARMLRGLRIAARLGLSLTKDTETAIHKLSSSIEKLDQFRLMLELNYMLSYGAAEASICLLHRFNLLEMFLPFHAAYLNEQTSKAPAQNCKMLMKLFCNLDKLVSCDRPAHCTLWVGILGFHQALVSNPQDALVIWVFASVLYHGKWKEGVEFAREHAKGQVKFVPEISGCPEIESDEELAQKVTKLASLVQDSVIALTETDCGLVVVPKRVGRAFCQMLSELVINIESYEKRKNNLLINNKLLGKGNSNETRFVLGEIILETLSGGLVPGKEKHQQVEFIEENLVKNQSVVKKKKRLGQLEFTEENPVTNQSVVRKKRRFGQLVFVEENPIMNQSVVRKNGGCGLASPDRETKPETAKKQKLVENNCPSFKQELAINKLMAIVNDERRQIAEELLKVVEVRQSPKGERNATQGNMLEKEDCQPLAEEAISKKIDKDKQVVQTKHSTKPLSSLFR